MRGIAPAVLVGLLAVPVAAADPLPRFVYPGADGRLVYDADARGNRVPDFSHCGYCGGGVAIPDAPVRVVVPAAAGDAGPRIQAAIDYVAGLTPDAAGVRGAVLLLAGRHEVAGQLRISAGGVVLRGQGEGAGGTVLVAAGTDRRTLVRVRGKADAKLAARTAVVDEYVPVGVAKLRLKSAAGLKPGDTVFVDHPSTKEWVVALGMDRFPPDNPNSWLDWRPGTMDLRWDRTVTRVDGDTVTLDAPLTAALDAKLSTVTVAGYSWPGRIEHVGVENLRLESAFDPANPKDEYHAWGGVGFENVRNAWVRQVTFAHLAGSAVAVWESGSAITVEDCTSLRPVSEDGGYRRHTFLTAGHRTLFQRCRAEHGRHDFAVGALAAGPNAFVHCRADAASHFSGPIESWATGVLFDNMTIDGGGLALTNREIDGQGAGWAGANSVLWQCSAPMIACRNPPTAQNWAFGCWGQFVGSGHWRQPNEFVKPDSLYAAQLADRLGAKAVENLKKRPVPARGTEPGVRNAADLPAPGDSHRAPRSNGPLSLKNGRLTVGDDLLAGGRAGTVWWRGHVLPGRAAEMGLGVTRFVPGRDGRGFTDDLDELTDGMRANGLAALDHHWGLWYDRRRDDHQMIRRADGQVWPPFYEQPWARTGTGTAWDGLSKYDLTKFNPWYFARLKEFADLAERKGLLLVQQMYFQHNILEAGAHWADFPWRPANCLQDTGFPEPPPYAGNKRVFMADEFYDVSHPVRRGLHRAYIRHCLDVLGTCPNVVFQTGEEFTGPLPFVRFWLDTIAEWEKDAGRRVKVGLSCTKDVQDAILADPARGPRVAVIDLKYWWYTADGGVYDPKGGENLAPRQHLREWKGSKSHSDAATARAVREYRTKFPDKAVTVSYDGANGWAVAAAGGSVPNLPAGCDKALLAALPRMKPFAPKGLADGHFALADAGRDYLVFAPTGGPITLDLADRPETFAAAWVNPKTGAAATPAAEIRGGQVATLRTPGTGPAVLWLTKK